MNATVDILEKRLYNGAEMENFNQLLNQYVQRAGISDTELARAIGVSRQTIFRWREGTTGRPRHREDVLAMARKLRLTPEERDRLLLATGFPPEGRSEKGEEREEGEERGEGGKREERGEERESEAQAEGIASESRWIDAVARYRWRLGSGVAVVLAVVVIAAWWVNQRYGDGLLNTPTAEVVSPSTGAAPPTIARPTPGETLILVTHFANYAGGQVGYNVAGRLTQALQREIDNTRLKNIRLEIWPEAVGERSRALQIGRQVSATLVIYGEYDLGRVMVEFAHPANQNVFTDPAVQQQVTGLPELSATINSDLPQQVRSLALMALGQIYLTLNQADQARLLLAQARDNLKNEPEVDQKTWALANFYLGLAYHSSFPPDLDAAIAAYTEAVTAWPEMLSSQLDRSAAYEERALPGDLELALAGIEQIIQAKPDWA
ncbi:MAG: hypothetical protein EHM12_10360, partial [Dehalococcoidia bacterium]